MLSFKAFGQQAPPIKAVDIFGNMYNSSEIIADGNFIFIDFFANNCSTCQMVSPLIDSAFEYYGCNYDNIFFMAVNIYENSSDESVLNFCEQFGLSAPAISGEGGSGRIASDYEVPYTPFYTLIDTNGVKVFNKFFWIDSVAELIDTLSVFNDFVHCSCQGADFEYFRIISNKDTAYANIDKMNNIVRFIVKPDFDLTNANAKFITSPLASAFLNSELQNADSSIIDLSDTLHYAVFAQDDSIYKEWKVFAERSLNIETKRIKKLAYFDNINNVLHLSDYSELADYKIYDLSGKLLFIVRPTENEQNFSHLNRGVYLIVLETKNGYSQTEKIIVN